MKTQLNDLLASGDSRAALEGLVKAYGDALTRFCTGLVGSPAEAEELVQDTLLAALGALSTYRGTSPRAWVFGIARNLAASHLRKRDRRRGLFSRWQSPPLEVRPHARSDARLVVEAGLAVLRPKQREAVLLRYQQGFDAIEVGEILGISHAAARKRISVGVRALRLALDNDLSDIAALSTASGSTDAPTGPAHSLTSSRIQAHAHDENTNTQEPNESPSLEQLPTTGRVHAL